MGNSPQPRAKVQTESVGCSGPGPQLPFPENFTGTQDGSWQQDTLLATHLPPQNRQLHTCIRGSAAGTYMWFILGHS